MYVLDHQQTEYPGRRRDSESTDQDAESLELAVPTAQMATLALKHRQNKTERQRIVAFVGSPVRVGTGVSRRVGVNY